MLMEVMPCDLPIRDFGNLKTIQKLEPGYRDAPSDSENVAIMFIKVDKPEEVLQAEHRKDDCSVAEKERVRASLTAYNVAVSMYSDIVRKRLHLYYGYECKEPEPGKFTLAFRSLEDAIRWGAHVQLELLSLSWPADLLEMRQCQPVTDPQIKKNIWKGLRIRMGIAFGKPGKRQPLRTGRADYFGNQPNLAARISSFAAPGQILFEATQGFGFDVNWLQEGSLGLLCFAKEMKTNDGMNEEVIELQNIGKFVIKGLEQDPKVIYQALPKSLKSRHFEMDLGNFAVRLPESPTDHVRLVGGQILRNFWQQNRMLNWLSNSWKEMFGRFEVELHGDGFEDSLSECRTSGTQTCRVYDTTRFFGSTNIYSMPSRLSHTSQCVDLPCQSLSMTQTESPINDQTKNGLLEFQRMPSNPSLGCSQDDLPEKSGWSALSQRSQRNGQSFAEVLHRFPESSMPSVTSRAASSKRRLLESGGSSFSDAQLSMHSNLGKFPSLKQSGYGMNFDQPVATNDSPEVNDNYSSIGCDSIHNSTKCVTPKSYLERRDSDASAFSESRTPESYAREVAELYAQWGNTGYDSSPTYLPTTRPFVSYDVDLESQLPMQPQTSAHSAPDVLMAGMNNRNRHEFVPLQKSISFSRSGIGLERRRSRHSIIIFDKRACMGSNQECRDSMQPFE